MSAAKEQERTTRGRIERSLGGFYCQLDHNRLTRTPWAMIQTFSKAEGALMSGSMAYYAFLSLPPLLMVGGFVLAIASRLNVEVRATAEAAIDRLAPTVRSSDVLDQLIGAGVTLGVLGLVALVYAGTGFLGALTACLNRMWGLTSGRNPLGQKLVNLSVVTLLVTLVLGSVTVTLWATSLAAAFGQGIVTAVELGASIVSMFVVLLILYRLLPARRLSWRSQAPGAVLAALGIELLERGFALWARHSAGVALLPRSLLSIVLLLAWMGFFGQVILYGAALNVVLAGPPGASGSPSLHPRQSPPRPADGEDDGFSHGDGGVGGVWVP